MAYDLEEQEQLDSVKSLWKKHGNWITWVLIVVLACVAAYSWWGYYQRKQTAQASQMYYEMQNAVMTKDFDRVKRIAQDTQEQFSGTPYAPMISLVAAKMAYESNDLETAKQELRWIIDNSKYEGYQAVARIRLAGIFLDEKQYDEGLSLLAFDFPEAFASLAEDRKGDLYVAQNKIEDARLAYRAALDKSTSDNPGKQLIQLKLEEVGDAQPSKG